MFVFVGKKKSTHILQAERKHFFFGVVGGSFFRLFFGFCWFLGFFAAVILAGSGSRLCGNGHKRQFIRFFRAVKRKIAGVFAIFLVVLFARPVWAACFRVVGATDGANYFFGSRAGGHFLFNTGLNLGYQVCIRCSFHHVAFKQELC